MPAPLLLVDDDLATIAQVKRLLAREGYEVVLATNAADAVIAWGHHLPPLVLLSPRVESDRGAVVLEELTALPEASLLKVLLLGETVPGFGYPVATLPLDPGTFAKTVNELVQGTTSGEGWQVHVSPRTLAGAPAEPSPELPPESPDSWRASRPPAVPGRRDPHEAAASPEPGPGAPAPRGAAELEVSLFGDLESQVASEVEAQAIASVDASLARLPVDDELQALEDDVRAEAARRRALRQSPEAPSVGLPTPDRAPPPEQVAGAPEDAFAGFDETPAAAPEAPAPSAPEQLDEAAAEKLRAELERARGTLQRAEQVAQAAEGALAASDRALAERIDALEGELVQARQAAERAEEQLRDAQAAQPELDQALQQEAAARRGAEDECRQLRSEVERLEAELKEARAALTQRSEAAATLELELKDAREQWDRGASERRALEQALEQARAGAETLTEQVRSQAEALEATHGEVAARLREERDALKAELADLRAQTDELSVVAQRAAGAVREAVEEAEEAEQRAQQAQAESQQAQAELAARGHAASAAAEETERLKARVEEAEQSAAGLSREVEELRAELAGLKQARRGLEEALEDARAANLEVRNRIEASEARARLLEEKAVMPLEVPNRAEAAVPRFGTVDLGTLARLVGQLVLARSEVRLELAAPGGRRVLWLARGAVVAAESGFAHESLLERARRDGLIDSRQAADLKLLRSATPAETLEVLKARGRVREAEVVPLLQRYTEQVALDAFSEPASEYRLTETAPEPGTLVATLARPTLPLVAEALRRALPAEQLLEQLGGSEAVPVAVESGLDLRALGFTDKERRMLGYCDGEANVEDLALASGLKADLAFRALLVARLLGLVELKVPARRAVAAGPALDVERLDAKFEQVQEADYFTMLGLGRAAGSDEVERAWRRLSEEYDPLKYSGHPDAGLQQRAQLVYSVLEEAARALGDDRRRAEYARHLVD